MTGIISSRYGNIRSLWYQVAASRCSPGALVPKDSVQLVTSLSVDMDSKGLRLEQRTIVCALWSNHGFVRLETNDWLMAGSSCSVVVVLAFLKGILHMVTHCHNITKRLFERLRSANT